MENAGFSLIKEIQATSKKSLAVLGFGVTGQSVARFLRRKAIPFRIFDEKAVALGEVIERDFMSAVSAQEIVGVVLSPSFLHHDWVRFARQSGLPCFTDLDLFSVFYRPKTIAVTGTVGKTSTSMMLEHFLKRTGCRVALAGNIGVSPLEFSELFDEDSKSYLICEVSSYQAMALKWFSPDAVLWTNFSPNHLDHHRTLLEYFSAKNRLLENSLGVRLVDESVAQMAQNLSVMLPPNTKISPSSEIACEGFHLAPCFAFTPFRRNLFLAQEILRLLGFDVRNFKRYFNDFVPPEHRMNCFLKKKNVHFWNDSKSTNIRSVCAAINYALTLSGKVVWVTDGQTKGEDLSVFSDVVRSVDDIIGMGVMGRKIVEKFGGIFAENETEFVKILQEILRKAETANRVDVVYSPGFSSFDRFKNFAERGCWWESLIQRNFNSSINN